MIFKIYVRRDLENMDRKILVVKESEVFHLIGTIDTDYNLDKQIKKLKEAYRNELSQCLRKRDR